MRYSADESHICGSNIYLTRERKREKYNALLYKCSKHTNCNVCKRQRSAHAQFAWNVLQYNVVGPAIGLIKSNRAYRPPINKVNTSHGVCRQAQ